jgi:multicomponent Na+:H+ antiporter subunit E
MVRYLLIMIPLLLIYLALTANLEPVNILLGAILAALAVYFVRPGKIINNLRNLPQAIWAMFRFLVQLVKDLIESGIIVAKIVLSPDLPIYPGIVRIKTGSLSEIGEALTDYAITLTPGEIVMEMTEEDEFFVHCLDARHSEQYIHDAQALYEDIVTKILQ